MSERLNAERMMSQLMMNAQTSGVAAAAACCAQLCDAALPSLQVRRQGGRAARRAHGGGEETPARLLSCRAARPTGCRRWRGGVLRRGPPCSRLLLPPRVSAPFERRRRRLLNDCAFAVRPFACRPCTFRAPQATDALVQLIKDHGRWVDLPEPEEAEAEAAVAAA